MKMLLLSCAALALATPAAQPRAVALGEAADVGQGITVTPLVVEEDSRCPSDVSCIWAGRLVLRASVEKGDKSEEKLLELGVPARTMGGMLTLTDAGPAPVSTGPAPEYRFTFSYAPDLAQ